MITLVLLLIVTTSTRANPDAKRLYDDLLSNYNRLIRPVVNHTEKVTVKLGLRLSQLVDLNLKDQILTTNVWLEHVSMVSRALKDIKHATLFTTRNGMITSFRGTHLSMEE